MHASVNRVSIGSDNGLSPIRRQAIILTNAGLDTSEQVSVQFLSKYKYFIHEKHLKISSAKRRPFGPVEMS